MDLSGILVVKLPSGEMYLYNHEKLVMVSSRLVDSEDIHKIANGMVKSSFGAYKYISLKSVEDDLFSNLREDSCTSDYRMNNYHHKEVLEYIKARIHPVFIDFKGGQIVGSLIYDVSPYLKNGEKIKDIFIDEEAGQLKDSFIQRVLGADFPPLAGDALVKKEGHPFTVTACPHDFFNWDLISRCKKRQKVKIHDI